MDKLIDAAKILLTSDLPSDAYSSTHISHVFHWPFIQMQDLLTGNFPNLSNTDLRARFEEINILIDNSDYLDRSDTFPLVYLIDRMVLAPEKKLDLFTSLLIFELSNALVAKTQIEASTAMIKAQMAFGEVGLRSSPMDIFERQCAWEFGAERSLSKRQKKAANKRHEENHSMKSECIEHYITNKADYKNMTDAAEKIANVIVPVKYTTVYNWIREYNKKLKS